MLFDKRRPPRCEYCLHGTRLDARGTTICLAHGVSDAGDSCRRFAYDPTKREPDPPPARYVPKAFSEEDFAL